MQVINTATLCLRRAGRAFAEKKARRRCRAMEKAIRLAGIGEAGGPIHNTPSGLSCSRTRAKTYRQGFAWQRLNKPQGAVEFGTARPVKYRPSHAAEK
ncbi:Hypothetical protein NTJ_13459 [Nesidiocoris tenuis]|uniref:Uncharacterized protein n=1 Tax=Nesidiocoris tenuis TaxID=355587 RepID=A0ABN7BCV0_9HEMI|nr:Hypothetical protein NTJ_13459 [Nesidiocoris tenuis]